MAKYNKKHYTETYTYKCSITEEEFKLTRKIKKTDELISIQAYYQLYPEKDDRPEQIKKQYSTSDI